MQLPPFDVQGCEEEDRQYHNGSCVAGAVHVPEDQATWVARVGQIAEQASFIEQVAVQYGRNGYQAGD